MTWGTLVESFSHRKTTLRYPKSYIAAARGPRRAAAARPLLAVCNQRDDNRDKHHDHGDEDYEERTRAAGLLA